MSEIKAPRKRRANKAAALKLRAAVQDILVAYRRVSTNEQANSGAGLWAQEQALTQWAQAHGKTLIWLEDEGYSAGKMDNRPGLQKALDLVRDGKAGGIVVSKLDRLSRSMLDFCLLMDESQRAGFDIIALDFGLDTSTPSGKLMVGILALFAQFERDMIKMRTRDGLAAKRAQGVRLGAPTQASAELIARVWALWKRHESYSRAARELNAAAVPTATGKGAWHPDTVRKLMLSQDGCAQRPADVTLPHELEESNA